MTEHGMLSKELRRQVESLVEDHPGTSVSRTSKGHTLIKAPNGETMMISRNSGAGYKGLKKVDSDFRRCFG